MKTIHVSEIIQAVRGMCIEANYHLPQDIKDRIRQMRSEETFEAAGVILDQIIENFEIAGSQNVPMCQDTGMTFVLAEVGQDVHIEGELLEEAINEGIRQGYQEGYLRKSVVADPLQRTNTGDNTPGSISYSIVPGDKLKITIAPKGFGSENMSRLAMLKPSQGLDGVIDFVLETVKQAGSNPCPPIVVGIGLGGTFDKAALLAKKALLRGVADRNPDPYYNDLERQLLNKINGLGIGPQGFGGRTTALMVNIETYPTHIAGLPVAVNINCHASRHAEAEL